MIGATSRHSRRRSSIMLTSSIKRGSLLVRQSIEVARQGSLAEEDEMDAAMASAGLRAAVARRRAVDASDLRTCALVQSKLKTWKTFPFP